MKDICAHLDKIQDVTPSAAGCEDCLRSGGRWLPCCYCKYPTEGRPPGPTKAPRHYPGTEARHDRSARTHVDSPPPAPSSKVEPGCWEEEEETCSSRFLTS